MVLVDWFQEAGWVSKMTSTKQIFPTHSNVNEYNALPNPKYTQRPPTRRLQGLCVTHAWPPVSAAESSESPGNRHRQVLAGCWVPNKRRAPGEHFQLKCAEYQIRCVSKLSNTKVWLSPRSSFCCLGVPDLLSQGWVLGCCDGQHLLMVPFLCFTGWFTSWAKWAPFLIADLLKLCPFQQGLPHLRTRLPSWSYWSSDKFFSGDRCQDMMLHDSLGHDSVTSFSWTLTHFVWCCNCPGCIQDAGYDFRHWDYMCCHMGYWHCSVDLWFAKKPSST